MIKITLKSFLVVSFLFAPLSIQAADFDYTWGQASYDDVDLSLSGLPSFDGDGFTFSGSYEINSDVYLRGNLSMWDMDVGIDVDFIEFGAGYHMPLNKQADVIFEFVLGDLDIASINIDTWSLIAGARYLANNKLELGGKAGLTDYEGGDTELFLAFNALYSFKKNIAAVFEFRTEDNLDLMSFGVRFYM